MEVRGHRVRREVRAVPDGPDACTARVHVGRRMEEPAQQRPDGQQGEAAQARCDTPPRCGAPPRTGRAAVREGTKDQQHGQGHGRRHPFLLGQARHRYKDGGNAHASGLEGEEEAVGDRG